MLCRTVKLSDHYALIDATGEVIGEMFFDIRGSNKLQLIMSLNPEITIKVLPPRQVGHPDRLLRPVVLVPQGEPHAV